MSPFPGLDDVDGKGDGIAKTWMKTCTGKGCWPRQGQKVKSGQNVCSGDTRTFSSNELSPSYFAFSEHWLVNLNNLCLL